MAAPPRDLPPALPDPPTPETLLGRKLFDTTAEIVAPHGTLGATGPPIWWFAVISPDNRGLEGVAFTWPNA
jgi:hypothetical protein